MKKATKTVPTAPSPPAVTGGARAVGAAAARGSYRASGAAKEWGAPPPAGKGGAASGNEGAKYGAGELADWPGDGTVPEGMEGRGTYYGSLPPPRY